VQSLAQQLRPHALPGHARAEASVVVAAAAHFAHAGHDAVGAIGVVRGQPLLEQRVHLPGQAQHDAECTRRATLGSGFKIAMRDLEIRGAGNLLGSEQSGHITAVGFELYCQLLKHSVAALKGEKVKPRIETAVRLDFLSVGGGDDVMRDAGSVKDGGATAGSRITNHASLPLNYVPEPQQRIEIYRKLAQAEDRAAITALQKEVRDRFGPLPAPVEMLLLLGELKQIAAERGITAMEVREDKLMLTRNGDFVQVGGKFPRLTKKTPEARLKEIRRLLLAL